MKGENVDLIIHNAEIHCLDDLNTISEAMAIRNGRIIEVGPERQILNKYTANEYVDAENRAVYPGFVDAHGHILSYANQKLSVDLVGCTSLAEVITRTEKYQQKTQKKFIVGRGWDQSLWKMDSLPDNAMLNKAFPTIPVCLYRIDGHAALVNDCLLKMAGITPGAIEGGKIVLKNGKCSGLLIDNAMNLLKGFITPYTKPEIKQAIIEIQDELFQYGITGVHEAGIEFEDIDVFKSLIKSKELKLNIYAMLMPSEKNKNFAAKNGVYQFKNLSIRSFKLFADGALGSRGALLKDAYNDDHQNRGLLTTSLLKMQEMSDFCSKIGYQLNTHAIGDSANTIIMNLYKKEYLINKDHRWRIEHAQVLDPLDFKLFSEYAVFPSVQPTHAVSDMRWAETRLGKTRLKGAYGYKTLLNQAGMLAIGTDFPIESFNPFLTIHAAVQRMNEENSPSNGFLSNEAITLDQCINGMTKWAAFASFQENELGTLEKGKDATFTILDYPLSSSSEFKQNYAYMTFIKGKKVYTTE